MADAEQVVDSYHLANLIAQGNHSDVWEVRDPAGGQFAMKLLKPDAMKERDQVQTLKHEARVSKLLDHPNFVKFHKSAFTKQHAYLLMEYFRAPNVKTQIMADRTVLHVRFKKLVEHLCLVLQFMHDKGWIHRDLKPDNVLINKASELRLIDFSLATRAAGGLGALLGGGKAKVIQGTRTYIAPETIRKKPATPQTDMYSLGVTLFEILTGRPPFKAPTPDELLKQHLQLKPPAASDFHPNVSPEMDRLLLRLLEKKPANRPKTMNEVYAEFRSLKPFVEDPQELYDREEGVRRERELDGLRSADSVLNSRADAERQAAGIVAPKRKGKAQKIQAGQIYRDGAPVAAPTVAAQAPSNPPPAAMPAYPPPGMPPGVPYPYPPAPAYGAASAYGQPPMPWPQPPWGQAPYPAYGVPPAQPGAAPAGTVAPAAASIAGAPALPSAPAAAAASREATPGPAAAPAASRAANGSANREEAKRAAASQTDTGMVLSFAEPSKAATPGSGAPGSRPGAAAARGAQPAAPSGSAPEGKQASATGTADKTQAESSEDELPFMDELPEVI